MRIPTLLPALLTAVLAAGALPALAETPSAFSASLSYASGNQSLREFTGSTAGYALDGAWDSSGATVPVRFGVALARFGSGSHSVTNADGDTLTIDGPDFTTGQIYASFRTEPARDFRLYFGLSANRHRLSSDMAGQGSGQYVKGTKLGARVDLEYALTTRACLVGTFQWVEVGPSAAGHAMVAPSWFQFGARWTF
jgi:hypothetical protein